MHCLEPDVCEKRCQVHVIWYITVIISAAARLIFNMRQSEGITDALISLHWLRIPERIIFKVATLTFRALHSLLALLTCLTSEGCNLHHLISSTFRPSACQLLVVASFRLPVLRSGTAYQMTSPPLCPCQFSGAIWRHTYSAAVTTLTDTARTYSGYSGPRGGVAAQATSKIPVMMMIMMMMTMKVSAVCCRPWVDWCTCLWVGRQCVLMGHHQQSALSTLTTQLTCQSAQRSLSASLQPPTSALTVTTGQFLSILLALLILYLVNSWS